MNEATGNPWTNTIGELLADSSGNEERRWTTAEDVTHVLKALASTARAYAHAGSEGFFGEPEDGEAGCEGVFSGVADPQPPGAPEDPPTITLYVGGELLEVATDDIQLTYLPHRNGTEHAIFFLHAKPANAVATAWAVTRVGDPTLALAIGQRESLGLATSRWGPKSRRTSISYALWLRHELKRPNGGVYRTEEEARHEYEEAGKTELKANYLAYRGPRASGAMTQEDVNFVAFRALNLQLHPTMELLREVHGSGSPTSLHPKLKTFFQTLFENHLEPAPAANVPPAVARLYEQMMQEARQEAQAAQIRKEKALHLAQTAHEDAVANLAAERAAFAEQQANATAAMDELRTANGKLADDITRAKKTANDYKETVQNLYVELGDVHAARDKLEAELNATRGAASKLADEATVLNTRLEAREARVASLEGQLDSARTEAAELRTAAAKADTRHVEQRNGLMKELAELTRVRDLVVHQNATAIKALDIANGRVGALEADRDRFNQEVGRLTAALASVTRERDRLAEDIGPLREQVAGLVDELRGVVRHGRSAPVDAQPPDDDTVR